MEQKDKIVAIQKEINEAMEKEVETLIQNSKKNLLLDLIISGKIDDLSVREIKKRLLGEGNDNY